MKRDFSDLPRLQVRLSAVKLVTTVVMLVTFLIIPCHLIDQSNTSSTQGRVAGLATQAGDIVSQTSEQNNYLVIGALLLIIGGILLIYLVAPPAKPKVKRYVKKL